MTSRWRTAGILLIVNFIVLILLILPEQVRTPPARDSVDSWADYMIERIPRLMEAQGVPGLVIALIKDRKTVWVDAFGYADLEQKIPMTKETRCRVESISKSVTAWGVMKLVEEGRLDLDAPLETYLKTWSLPESPFSEEEITIKQLLSQTSGMPLGTIGVHYNPEDPVPPLEEYLKGQAVLFQEPGTSFSYSNAGYNLLEILIEEVTGREYAEYMSREILLPLDMEASSFIWSREWNPRIPHGYDTRGRAIPVYVYPDKASGGLFSTASDIASFVSAGMTGSSSGTSLLSETSIQSLYKSWTEMTGYYSLVFDGYGLGHFIESLENGVKVISNGGQGSGWMTQFYSIPETGDGIVLLSNSQRSWPLFSELLTDWSAWNGQPDAGMGIIKKSARLLRVFLVLCLNIMIIGSIRMAISLYRGRRKFILRNPTFKGSQLIMLILSAAMAALIIGISRMKYFFLSSVFPVETFWLGGVIIYGAALLFITAIVPVDQSA